MAALGDGSAIVVNETGVIRISQGMLLSQVSVVLFDVLCIVDTSHDMAMGNPSRGSFMRSGANTGG